MAFNGMKAVVLSCIIAYSFSFLVFGLQVNLLGPTAAVLAAKIGVVEADLGFIFTINGLASIIGALPSGWLVDKLPGHAVYAAAHAFQVGLHAADAQQHSLPYKCLPRLSARSS
jgi:MFS family permease